MSSWRTMVMENEADGDLDLTLRSAPYADMASPLARWHRISSALKQMPELRRYLADPRLRPSKVAKLSQSNTSSPGPMLGPLMDVLPIGAAAVATLDVEWLKAHDMVHLVGSHRQVKRQTNSSPAELFSPGERSKLLAAKPIPSPPNLTISPGPFARKTNEKRSSSRKRAKVPAKHNSPIPCGLVDKDMAERHTSRAGATHAYLPARISAQLLPRSISPLAPPGFVPR